MIFKETLSLLTKIGANIRILYVEDDALVRENTSDLLMAIFSYVKTACNGVEGISLYKEEPFDLVISDILMPEMNGIHMIKAIKEISPDQMVIVTSACEETQYHDNLANLGVSKFVLKPMNTQEMIQILYDTCVSISNEKTFYKPAL